MSVSVSAGAGAIAQAPAVAQELIGTANMPVDGSLTLHLRPESDSIVGDAHFKVAPDDPKYEESKPHVDDIKSGEIKPFVPWSETRDMSGDKRSEQ